MYTVSKRKGLFQCDTSMITYCNLNLHKETTLTFRDMKLHTKPFSGAFKTSSLVFLSFFHSFFRVFLCNLWKNLLQLYLSIKLIYLPSVPHVASSQSYVGAVVTSAVWLKILVSETGSKIEWSHRGVLVFRLELNHYICQANGKKSKNYHFNSW